MAQIYVYFYGEGIMINIVHINIHFNDERNITALELKMKAIPEEQGNRDRQHLVARVSAAFYSTTLFSDIGKTLKTTLNPKRNDVVNLFVSFEKNNLTLEDISRFIHSYQEALDNSPF